MLKYAITFLLLLLGGSAHAACTPDYLKTEYLAGKGEMRFMLWHLYDAELYAPGSRSIKDLQKGPFALRLTYHTNIKGKKIAEVSAVEIKKQGMPDLLQLAKWQRDMEEIFPDIIEGESLTGIFTGEKTIFCKGGNRIGVVEGREFAHYFFGIWFSEKTSAPNLRKKLLVNL